MKSNARKIKSVFIFPLHLGGSNGVKLELDAIFTPPYNAARYGISLTHSPRQADIVLLLGAATAKTTGPAFDLLSSLPDDVKLILLGSEATSAAPFAQGYATLGPILPSEENPAPKTSSERPKLASEGLLLPAGKSIAAYLAGSPPDPQAIIQAILQVANQ
jgi:Ni,Fe-hydrogenase III small subunit